MSEKIVKKINGTPDFSERHITDEQLKNEYNFCIAQKLTKSLLDNGYISIDEYDKISEINCHTFSPLLAEIMEK